MIAVITMVASIALPIAIGVLAPYGPAALNPLASAHGAIGTVIRVLVGTGQHRDIALMYLACGLILGGIALLSGRAGAIARFDAEVPDALPDDLLGIEALSRQPSAAVGS
jgi:hypothetical protein